MVVSFGELIKGWRKERRCSHKELARLSGVSAATLSRWETGRTLPRMAELEAVLTALQVSAAQRRQALALLQAPRAVEQLRSSAESGPPVSGDLLRAMRLRLGWTQQETARQAGIAQGTLARWEQSLDWPSAERLHALCYVLQAREAELLALTQGFLSVRLPLTVIPEPEEISGRVAHYMLYSPLADLEFLALEAQLWHLASIQDGAQMALSYTYGCHARYLVERRRFAEADVYVERTQERAQGGYRDVVGWAAAVIAASRIAGASGRMPDLKRALNVLTTWQHREPILRNRAYQAWITSEIALYLAQMGHSEVALRQSERALRIAGSVNPVEAAYRRGDHTKVLLQSGRYQEAVEEARECLNQGHPPIESLPFLLTGVQALLAVGRSGEAAEWLGQVDRILACSSEGNHYRPLAQALAQRLA